MERIPRWLDSLDERLHALRVLCAAWRRRHPRLVILLLVVPLALLPFAR